MFVKLFLVCVSVNLAFSKPQLLTYQDGTFGVNFGGYHAEAGLGGFLTGNAANGGLHASAGTPHGQQAGAGIGGILNGEGRTAGGGYAGATAGHGVGASAAFGGGLNSQTGGGGGVGAESHVPGYSKKVVKLSEVPSDQTITVVKTVTSNAAPKVSSGDTLIDTRFNLEDHEENVKQTPKKAVEKVVDGPHVTHIFTSIRPYQPSGDTPKVDSRNFFDFGVFSNTAAALAGPHAYSPANTQVQVQKTYNTVRTQIPNYPRPIIFRKNHWRPRFHLLGFLGNLVPTQVQTQEPKLEKRINTSGSSSSGHIQGGAQYNVNTRSLFDDIFNIPISTLTAVNRLLNNNLGGGVSYTKTVDASYG